MKKSTGELAWVRVSYEDTSKIAGCVWRHDTDGYIVLCEKRADIHTDQVSWRPIPIIHTPANGSVEL
jgi:hypothetical protein